MTIEQGEQPLSIFIPLTKVDVEQRLVFGKATEEKPDRSGEICDYLSSKPFFEAWSGEIAKNTSGKSYGNLRAMHGKVAAGKLTSINFNDEDKAVEVCAKIVDDDEWEKVLEGVYTGFSQGGRYVKRWADKQNPGLMRYTADPMEISLVDLPCLPSATFQVIKSADVIEDRHFVKTTITDTPEAPNEPDDGDDSGEDSDDEESVIAKAGHDAPERVEYWKCDCEAHRHKRARAAIKCRAATRASAEAAKTAAPVHNAINEIAGILGSSEIQNADDEAIYMSLTLKDSEEFSRYFSTAEKRYFSTEARAKAVASGEAMPDGSFPIKNKADLENAIHAVGRAKNPEAAKKHIIERAKALGCPECIPTDWEEKSTAKAKMLEDLAKYSGQEIDDSSYAIEILNMLSVLLSIEGMQDGQSDEQNQQAECLRAAISQVKDFICSEIKENNDDSDPVKLLEMAVRNLDLAKRGARNNQLDQDRLQKCHDLMKELGAQCEAMGEKADRAGQLEKALAEKAALQNELEKIAPALESIKAEIAKFRNSPAPARAAVNALGMPQLSSPPAPSNDIQAIAKMLAGLSQEERARVLMNDSLNRPIKI